MSSTIYNNTEVTTDDIVVRNTKKVNDIYDDTELRNRISYVEADVDSLEDADIAFDERISYVEANYISSVELQSHLDDYVTQNELQSQLDEYATEAYVQSKIDAIPQSDLSSYATKSYVADYVATYAPTPDLSEYVTKTDLNQTLVSYVTDTELQSQLDEYVTKNDLDNASYATKSYVVDYVSTYASQGSEVTYTYLSTYYPTKTLVNAMFSYDTLTGTLTITTLS